MLAPAGTPDPVVRRFHAALASALEKPELRERLANPLGVEVVASTPEVFGDFLDRQIDAWGRVIREQDIKPD